MGKVESLICGGAGARGLFATTAPCVPGSIRRCPISAWSLFATYRPVNERTPSERFQIRGSDIATASPSPSSHWRQGTPRRSDALGSTTGDNRGGASRAGHHGRSAAAATRLEPPPAATRVWCQALDSGIVRRAPTPSDDGPPSSSFMSDSRETSTGRFGTFGGVFTPCALTILGVIMFLRFGQVVGNSGVGWRARSCWRRRPSRP